MVSLENIAQRYADEAAIALRAELQRYREREPLIQKLLLESENMVRTDYGEHGLYKETLREARDAVRDFKI